MFEKTGISEGMKVRSSDGENLGRVIAVREESFDIEKGLFFPKDYSVLFSDVYEISGGEVFLRTGREALREAGTRSAGASRSSGVEAQDELRIPVSEEELEVTKREREVGAVRVRKEVVEERKIVEVPVFKEVVHVERTAATGETLPPGAEAFESKEVVIPVKEEEVEVRKRTVVKGEVRVRKERQVEHRTADENLRREQVEVADEGEVRQTPVPGAYREPDK